MKEKIKLFYISRTSKFTGAENILLDVVNNIDKKKFDPLVVIPDTKGFFYEKLRDSKINIMVIRMPFLRVTYNPFLILWFLINILIVNFRFYFIFKKSRTGIIVCHTIQEMAYVFLAVKVLRKKLIICFKNILDRKWKKVIRARFCQLFVDRIIAVSGKAAEDFILYSSKPKRYESLTSVVHDSIDYYKYMENFEQKDVFSKYFIKKEDDFIILNIGSITELKGQLLLLEAISSNRLIGLNLKVIFLGDIYHISDLKYKNKLLNFIERNKLKEKVFLTGYQKDVKSFLNLSDILVHCPVIDDALPRVVLEGFIFNNIVIATKVGGIPEMVIDNYNGFLCEVDKENLAEKILYVYNNRKNLEYIKRNAIKTIKEDFSLKNQIKELENIYIKVMNKGHE